MSICHRSERDKSLQELSTESKASIWYCLMLRVLQLMVEYGNAKRDMTEAYYYNNKAQREELHDFEKAYSTQTAIWWYTHGSFLYRLLNTALRVQDVKIIFKFRLFINDLQNQIEKLYNEYFNKHFSESNHHFTVYHGQVLTMEEIEQFQKNENELSTMNNLFQWYITIRDS
ncbi:unnamed protein product [Rotaria sp. Silwood1]|nr:unnamed protein product [Rotaria sp. Silwood1]